MSGNSKVFLAFTLEMNNLNPYKLSQQSMSITIFKFTKMLSHPGFSLSEEQASACNETKCKGLAI